MPSDARHRMEYRVVWKRVALQRKTKRYATLRGAERWVALLTSDEPWRTYAPDRGGDDFVCCSGFECGCGGETHRQYSDRRRAEIPALIFARIEQRPVGKWTDLEDRRADN